MAKSTPEIMRQAHASRAGRSRSSPPAISDHQLLRVIGRGSYGEVWLARNVLGQNRAIKVIYREDFEDERPFEREFRGIKEFEPFSRRHESQVDILHVGRNDRDGYFYYVMELADAANPERQAEDDYQPLTLRYKLKQHVRLPVQECIELGLALSDALEVLHQNKLVHRDIKPSNIIFIGGVPKLADIGLVTRTDDAGSIVGTYGFVAPEGPGTPEADIYSLGMALYEASTGYKASEYPRPLSALKDIPDAQAWVELNDIILRACARDVRRRYQSVAELRTDLRLVRDGKSVRAIHAQRRRLKVMGQVAVAGVILLLAGLGVRSLWKSPQRAGAIATPQSGSQQALSEEIFSPAPLTPTLRIARTLDMPGVLHWPAGLIGRWERYREPLLFLPVDQKLNVISSQAQGYSVNSKLMPLSPGVALTLNFVSDINGDGSDETVVSGREGDNLFASVLDAGLTEIKRFKVPVEKRPGMLGEVVVNGLWAKCVVDLKGDGRKQMLALMGTAYSGDGPKPRHVVCFDYESQRQLWKHEMGPFGLTLEAADLDNDGVKEIIVSSEGLSNGNIASDGTHDDQSVLYVLRHDGTVLWKRELGGYFTRAYALIADLDGTGTAGVFGWVKDAYEFRRKYRERENGKIVRFDSQGKILHAYDAGLQLVSCRWAELDSDRQRKVLAMDRQGYMHVLDSRLRLLAKVQVVTNRFDRVGAEIAAVADLDNDGKKELILTSGQEEFRSGFNEGKSSREPPNARVFHENCIIVLDSEFRPLTRYLLAEEWNETATITVHVADFAGHGHLQLLSLANKALVLEYDSERQSTTAAR